MIFFFVTRHTMMNNSNTKRIVLFLLAWATIGFAGYRLGNGKTDGREKSSAVPRHQSTGSAVIYFDGDKGAEFLGHHYLGLKYPNALYQGFLAVHFDEMDSVLTFHSAAGRTNARANPGDRNTFTRITGHFEEDSEHAVDNLSFTTGSMSDRFVIKEIIETQKDSGYAIDVTFVVEFYRPVDDTISFSNFKFLLGYDGDIGSSLGGFSNDSSGYYEDDSTAAVYVFDDSLGLYSGMAMVDKPAYAAGGNFAAWHQTVNKEDADDRDLDTLLYSVMTQPGFTAEAQNTDAMVYWAVDLGTITPLDTVRDTLRFRWINGRTKSAVIGAAHGMISKDVLLPHQEVDVPGRMILHANFPNPFNPNTCIAFELESESLVSLKVYNVLGQEIVTLFRGRAAAGVHKLDWDGRDRRGVPVSSGVYLYRLTSGQTVLTRKMLLLK